MKHIVMKCAMIREPEPEDKFKVDYHDPFVELDLNVSQATKDLQSWKEIIISHSSIAIAAEKSVRDFSDSRRSIASFFSYWQVTPQNDRLNKGLKKMGNGQKELHLLAEKYRSHLSTTMLVPSECLLNQLQMVEDIKRQCEAKRLLYQQLKLKKEKRRLRSRKGEASLLKQFETAQDEYHKWGSFYVHRSKCLKEALEQSLITESFQNFKAEISFFKNALFLYEAIAEEVSRAFEYRSIDCQLSGSNKGGDSDNGDGSSGNRTDQDSDESSLQKLIEKPNNEAVSPIPNDVKVRATNWKDELSSSSSVKNVDSKNCSCHQENVVHEHAVSNSGESTKDINHHNGTVTKIPEIQQPIEGVVIDESSPMRVRKGTHVSSIVDSFEKGMILNTNNKMATEIQLASSPKLQVSGHQEFLRHPSLSNHGKYPYVFDGSSIFKRNLQIQMLPELGISLYMPSVELGVGKTDQALHYSKQPRSGREHLSSSYTNSNGNFNDKEISNGNADRLAIHEI